MESEETGPPTYLMALGAVAGDPEQTEALATRIRPRLVAWFRRRMGARLLSRAAPEDLAQEALVEIVQRLATFRPQGPAAFRGWLRRILRSRLTDLGRARTRIPHHRASFRRPPPGPPTRTVTNWPNASARAGWPMSFSSATATCAAKSP